ELFEDAGEHIEEYFNYKRIDVACKYFFENGKIIHAYTNPEAFAAELYAHAGEQRAAVSAYLAESEKVYHTIGSFFLDNSLHKRKTWLNARIFTAFKTVKFSYLSQTLDQYNRKKFKTKEAAQIFNRFATYNGSNPYKAPAMLSLIPHLEMNEGTFYPTGGMISITNALYKLAQKKGVQFCFNSPVQRIIHSEGKAYGVVVNNENMYADVVVSNADIYFTYKNLLNHSNEARKVLKQERSSSAVIFYWGMNKMFSELGLHNIIFSSNYKEEFKYIFNLKKGYSDPTVYINITSKEETEHAPAGKENWFVMINVPANTGQNWEEIVATAKKNIIQKLNRILNTDIESLIETETITDPVSIENNTGSYQGSLYGTSSNSKMAAFFRAPNFTGYIKNLYCCGGSVHPGGGIPLCLKSARITAAIIENDFKKKRTYSH
ncbi:MAG: phytoene desaturase, partial [Gloeobacteraceae cyanobacterium ES-bin-316]|nr:phytoene desaturase [Ferruginibacter sp.]